MEIETTTDKEGRVEDITEDQLYVLLGLRDEDKKDRKRREVAARVAPTATDVNDT